MNDQNLTPPGDPILPGSDFVLRLRLTTSAGLPITGARPVLRLRIEADGLPPSDLTGSALTEDGDGWYSHTFRVTLPGIHWFSWQYSASPARVKEGYFIVEERRCP